MSKVKVGSAEVSKAEVGSVEGGSAEVGFAEVGTVEIGFVEIGSNEVGLTEGGPSEIGFVEVGSAEVGLTEIGSAEVGLTEGGPPEVWFYFFVLCSPCVPGVYSLSEQIRLLLVCHRVFLLRCAHIIERHTPICKYRSAVLAFLGSWKDEEVLTCGRCSGAML